MTQLDIEDTHINALAISVLQDHQGDTEAELAQAVSQLLEERKRMRETIATMVRKMDDFYGSVPSFLRVQA